MFKNYLKFATRSGIKYGLYKTLIAKKDNPSINKIWINAPGYQITLQIQCDFLQLLFNLKQDDSNFNLVSILLQQNIKKKKGEFKVDSETSDAGDDQSKLREASKDIGMIKV